MQPLVGARQKRRGMLDVTNAGCVTEYLWSARDPAFKTGNTGTELRGLEERLHGVRQEREAGVQGQGRAPHGAGD
eukprot:3993467-Pyramimonas_sp.AAC.1